VRVYGMEMGRGTRWAVCVCVGGGGRPYPNPYPYPYPNPNARAIKRHPMATRGGSLMGRGHGTARQAGAGHCTAHHRQGPDLGPPTQGRGRTFGAERARLVLARVGAGLAPGVGAPSSRARFSVPG
jgi:hypothetical protein